MAKITVSVSLLWSDTGGDQIKGTITTTTTQAGTHAVGNVQAIGTSSEAVLLGDVTGAKLILFENRDPVNVIYVDTANPATTGAAIKLQPAGTAGSGQLVTTTVDAWYSIAVGGTSNLGVTAMQL